MRRMLQDLKRELGLRGTQVMDPSLQDRLAFHLLRRRGYEAFIAGQISRTEFGKRLAQEWASFSVLSALRGAHRQLQRGQSYFTGDPLNKALVSAEEFERVIDEAKALGAAGQSVVLGGAGSQVTTGDMLRVLPRSVAPSSPESRVIYMANGGSWNPKGMTGGFAYPVMCRPDRVAVDGGYVLLGQT